MPNFVDTICEISLKNLLKSLWKHGDGAQKLPIFTKRCMPEGTTGHIYLVYIFNWMKKLEKREKTTHRIT